VYVLGAGVNQSIRTIDRQPVFSPPLSHNFFKIARNLPKSRFRDYDALLSPLYNYIFKYWHKTKSDLEIDDFDLEECFSLIQSQLTQARLEKDNQTVNDLLKIQYFLIAFFAEVLSEFHDYYLVSPTMLGFGKVLYNEQAMIITFNYDLFIEIVIELGSGKNNAELNYLNRFQRDLPEEEQSTIVPNSEWKWNRVLAYGIKFDRVLLHDGSITFREKFFDKRIFYSSKKNKLYPWSILKLHGSLNWWKYVNATPNPYISHEELEILYELKKKQIVLENLVWFLPSSDTPYNEDQLFVEPIIITPVLHKQFYDEKFIYQKVFDPLWRKAKSSLSKCKSFIIGYSFPATDFHAKRLFLESFSDNIINELIIVNPDPNAIEETKRMTQFRQIRIFKNLEGFMLYRISEYSALLCFCCLYPL
jgi:hypothetical protein